MTRKLCSVAGTKPLVCHGPDADLRRWSKGCPGPGGSFTNLWQFTDSRQDLRVPMGRRYTSPCNEEHKHYHH